MTVAGLILAAGGGSRYRGASHKLLAPHLGRPLVATAFAAALDAGFDAVATIMGAVDLRALAPGGMVVLHNPDWARGLATSLDVGLQWSEREGFEAVVVGLGDTPGVPASAWRAVRVSGAEVAVASFAGQLRPPVRIARTLFGDVPRIGDVGARVLWERPGTVVVECEGDPSDVDTEEDLAALCGGSSPPLPMPR